MRIAVCAAVLIFSVPGVVSAQGLPFVEVWSEISPVTIAADGVTWHVARAAAGIREDGRFGVVGIVERQRRGGEIDWSVAGSGYRRARGWTLSGGAGVSPDPAFLYRRSVEGELARDVRGGLVVHGAYRHLAFPAASVHLLQPAVSWHFPRGHVEARGFLVRNTTLDRRSGTLLVRGAFDASPRLRLVGGAARGTRIFDVASLPGAASPAWVVFAAADLRVAHQWTVSAGVGGAREEPLFSQRTVGVGLRWQRR